jgi:hypothetical protein
LACCDRRLLQGTGSIQRVGAPNCRKQEAGSALIRRPYNQTVSLAWFPTRASEGQTLKPPEAGHSLGEKTNPPRHPSHTCTPTPRRARVTPLGHPCRTSCSRLPLRASCSFCLVHSHLLYTPYPVIRSPACCADNSIARLSFLIHHRARCIPSARLSNRPSQRSDAIISKTCAPARLLRRTELNPPHLRAIPGFATLTQLATPHTRSFLVRKPELLDQMSCSTFSGRTSATQNKYNGCSSGISRRRRPGQRRAGQSRNPITEDWVG